MFFFTLEFYYCGCDDEIVDKKKKSD